GAADRHRPRRLFHRRAEDGRETPGRETPAKKPRGRRAPAGAGLMNDIVTGIDHAMVLVRDLDRAAASWRRLGFTLTERGRHTRLGTHNHCMMLGRDYLEILGIVEPTPDNAPRAAMLADRE